MFLAHSGKIPVHVPGKEGIQLLAETRKRIDIKVPGENRLLGLGVGFLILVSAVYAGLKIYTNKLEGEMTSLDIQLTAIQHDKKAEDELFALSKQTGVVEQYLKNHIFWTQALGKISNDLQPQVQLKSLSASLVKGDIDFTAQAPSYSIVARQIATFLADGGVKDAALSNAKSNNGGGVEFSVNLLFDPAQYLKKQTK